jgi:hypothetical protein
LVETAESVEKGGVYRDYSGETIELIEGRIF